MSVSMIEGMNKVSISSFEGYWDFFLTDGLKLHSTSGSRCSHCPRYLSYVYVHIINNLKRKKLLPDDFVPICCICNFIIKELGYLKCKRCGGLLTTSAIGLPAKITVKFIQCTKCKREVKEVAYIDGRRLKISF